MDNREIDALVAERIFGWRVQQVYDPVTDSMEYYVRARPGGHLFPSFNVGGVDENNQRVDFAGAFLPRYSSGIAAAWTVIEHMRGLGFDFVITTNLDGHYACTISKGYKLADPHGTAADPNNVSIAICRAALAALGEGE